MRLTAVSPEGSRLELLDRALPAPRARTSPSSSRSGQAGPAASSASLCFFELDAPSLLPRRLDVRDGERATDVRSEIAGPAPDRTTCPRCEHASWTTPARDSSPDDRADGGPRPSRDDADPGPASTRTIKIETVTELRHAAGRSRRLDRRAALQAASSTSRPSSRSSPTTRRCSASDLIYVLDSPEDARRAVEHVASHLFRSTASRSGSRCWSRTSASPARTTPARRSPAAGCCCC